MSFTEEQKLHVLKQLHGHRRESGNKTIILDKDTSTSFELLVERGVFSSDIMSSAVYLARFLYNHQDLYFEKDVVDIGCGPGTQGIVMSKYGAKSVLFSDINPKAVDNTKKILNNKILQIPKFMRVIYLIASLKTKVMMLLCSIILSFLENSKNLMVILIEMKC